MKSPYVRDLRPNQLETAIFLVRSKEVRQKKTGEPYLSLLLGDKSGDIDAKMWDNVAEVIDTFDRDDFVRAKGVLNVYQNRPQFTVHKLVRLDEAEVDPADFFPVSSRNLDEMWTELRGIVAGMSNPDLKALVEALLDDPEIGRLYRRAPAAKMIHHAYLGGLIEHVLSLCTLCRFMAGHYSNIDLDLLLTGAVLHDIGKIYELSYERSFSYTTEGQLLGHITISIRLMEQKLRELPDFPPRLRALVEHMILSHHGQLEYGSPKVPLFPEAMLLHYLDDLDSKMECMRVLVEHDRKVEGEWTSYSQPLDRTVLKKLRYLEGEPEPDPPAAAVPTTVEAKGTPAKAKPTSRPNRPDRGPSLFGERLLDALDKED